MRAIPAMLLASLLVTACGQEVVRPTVNVSIGQQLIDLKQARASGALTQAEYERQRQQLIDNFQ